jgi:hypothetical protein
MKITFDNYKKILDSGIVKRGIEYFKKGNVLSCSAIEPGQYIATVSGTKEYTIHLTVEDRTISSMRCNCPYDMGPVCKHLVAVINSIENAGKSVNGSFEKKRTTSSKEKKQNSKNSTVQDILANIPKNELSAYIENQCAYDPILKRTLMSHFNQYINDTSVSFYKKELQMILREVKGRKGFIEWHDTGYVANFAYDLIQTAEASAERKHYADALHICIAMFETLIPALQYADDSNGDIGGPINAAMELFSKIACESVIDEDTKKETLQTIFRLFDKKLFAGWDWNTEILAAAASFALSETEAENIFKRLKTLMRSDFEKEASQMIQYNLLVKINRRSEADKLLINNLSNSSFREKAIDLALSYKDYNRAEQLAFNGIEQDKKDRPGLVCRWYDRLLQISEMTENTEKTIEYARIRYLSSFNPSRDYYAILKINISADEWPAYVDGLIAEIRKTKSWHNESLIPQIYIAEKRWTSLLAFLQNDPSFQSLEGYEKYLKKDYPSELAYLYEKCIIEELPKTVGRPFYKTVCRYMRRMQKLGAHDNVTKLAVKLREDYRQRKALIEELEEF